MTPHVDSRILLLGILQAGDPIGGGGPPDPCAGCPAFAAVSPTEYCCCETDEEGHNTYQQLYHDGCCGFTWVSRSGACP